MAEGVISSKPRSARATDTDTDSENVVVAVTGGVYVGVADGTAAVPTDATTELGAGWTNVGYISEDAVTENIETDTNEIVAWQNSDVVRTLVTKFGVSYQFTMIETKAAAVGLYYGKDVVAGQTTHDIGGPRVGRGPFVIDAIDSAGQIMRRYIPVGEVTERGEVAITATDAVGYDTTISAYPTPDLDGASVRVWYGTALA